MVLAQPLVWNVAVTSQVYLCERLVLDQRVRKLLPGVLIEIVGRQV